MRKRCPKCGNDDELVENSARVLLHALPQLSSPIEVEVPFTCAACGHEVSTTFRFRATGAQDPRPRAAEGQDGTKRLGRIIHSFDGKSFMSVQYPGILCPRENVLFPEHEGGLSDGGAIDRHGDPDLMVEFSEEYLKQYRLLAPMGRLPRTVSETMPALLLLIVAAELVLKAYQA